MSFHSFFKRRDWFTDLFGFVESPKSVYEYLKCDYDKYILTDSKNLKQFNTGLFKIASHDSFKNLKPRGKGTFSIISGAGESSLQPDLVSVLHSQSLPQNNGATFQAISHFNCLHFSNPQMTPSDGITGYFRTRTQGPFCALACPPSTLFRNYFIKMPNGEIGQLNSQLNLLEKTPICVKNGIPRITRIDVGRLSSFDFTDENAYEVGIHSECDVYLTQKNREIVQTSVKQRVHHVYCGALDFGSYVYKNDFTYNVAYNVLKNDYALTIKAAWENSLKYPHKAGSNKLFLTLLGSGIYSTPREIIYKSILENKKLIFDSGLQVFLVFNSQYSMCSAFLEFEQMMNDLGGKFIDSVPFSPRRK